MTDDLHAEAVVTLSADHWHMIASPCKDQHFSSQSETVAPMMLLAVMPNRATADGPRFFDKIYLVVETFYSGTATRHPSAHSPPDHN